jgi:hypothetical protein
MFEQLQEYLPVLIPLIIVELGLMLAAVIDILRRRTYRVGSRAIWLVVCIVFGFIGPVLYFAIGRGDE